jgi:toxin YoeB
MILSWAETACEDYLYWQIADKKVLKRINLLIVDIQRHPFTGLGDPEPLRYN